MRAAVFVLTGMHNVMQDHHDRARLRAKGQAKRKSLGLEDTHEDHAPGVSGLFDELVFGGLWARPGLPQHERMIATLASLAALERHSALKRYAEAALKIGVTTAAVREVILQAALYTGFIAGEENLRIVNEVLGQPEMQSETLPAGQGAEGPSADADLGAMGAALMEEMHGPRARTGYASGDGSPTALYDLAIRYGYGLLWNRPGLTRRERFITTVAVFTSLEQHAQLAKFAASAQDNGLGFEEIVEVAMQVAPYCGFPRALNGLAALDQHRA
jgi:4-carboxymuconolactone decarboxylase